MQVVLTSLILAAVLCYVLYAGGRWALHGDGYWPRGVLGVVLALVFVFGVPCTVLVAFNAIKHKKPIYWIIPPLHNTRSIP